MKVKAAQHGDLDAEAKEALTILLESPKQKGTA